MKRGFLILTFFSMIMFYLSSCETDFDITADYKDYTIVYGLLNRDSNTYVKINKAFLGNESALIMAKIQDSNEYQSEVTAQMEEWAGNTLIKTINLESTEINNKEDGIFYNPYQTVYFTDETLNENSTYKLNVQVNGKTITSHTEIIPDFFINRPRAGAPSIKFLDNPDIFNKVEWDTPENGKYFEVTIRFRYREKIIGETDSVYRHFDWKIGTITVENTEGGGVVEVGYKPSQFYSLCSSNIPYNDSELEQRVDARVPVGVDFIISVANEDLYTYIEVNQSGGGITQVIPEYSNIENGLGIFASRYKKKMTKLLDLESYKTLETLNIKF